MIPGFKGEILFSNLCLKVLFPFMKHGLLSVLRAHKFKDGDFENITLF